MPNGRVTTPPPYPAPASTVTSGPLVLLDPYIEVNGVNLSCLCLEAEITATTKSITVTTFCGETDYPTYTTWHFVAKFAQNYDVGGTHDTLKTAVQAWDGSLPPGGISCPVLVVPDQSQAVSVTNPEWKGRVIPTPYNKFGGAAGTLSEVDIDWPFESEPDVFNVWTPSDPGTPGLSKPAEPAA